VPAFTKEEVLMRFAEGIEEMLRVSDTFSDELEAARFWKVGADAVHSIEDLMYRGGAGQDQRARLYRCGPGSAPVLVFIHGGGWYSGTIEMNERACCAYAAQAGCHVASLSYRLAPANPFPAGLEDCMAAVSWLQEAGVEGLDTTRMAIGGPSAGANLALATAQSLPRDTFRAVLLFYGIYGNNTDLPSYKEYANGPVITRDGVEAVFEMYDPGARHRNDPRLAPLLGDLSGLPPVLSVAAEFDVLTDENEVLAQALAKAGVETEAWTEPGTVHGFINRGRLVPAADKCLSRSAEFLRARL